MTVEPDARKDVGAAHADDVRERANTVGPESSHTSPFRVLFAVVPLLVIVVVGATLLLGLWTTSFEQAAREERQGPAEPLRLDEDPFAPAAPAEAPTPQAEAGFDAKVVTALLADASPQEGATSFRFCASCHAGEKNAPARLGPPLWGIVGREKATHPAYAYSAALRAKGGAWSYEELAEFLHNPRTFAPGTSMAFAGISNNERIADLLAYLRTLADDPAPLPDQAHQR